MLNHTLEKFHSGIDLDENDKFFLKKVITSSNNVSDIEAAIYPYAYSFDKDRDIINKIEYFIFDNPQPGITAVCFEAVMRLWVPDTKYVPAMAKYLDYSKYDDWYYEVVMCTNILRNEPELQTPEIIERMKKLNEDAILAGNDDLIEVLNAR